jgi:hypothetical protein
MLMVSPNIWITRLCMGMKETLKTIFGRFLIIDRDPQEPYATSLGMDPEQGMFYLQLIPGNQATGQVQGNIQEKPISYLVSRVR